MRWRLQGDTDDFNCLDVVPELPVADLAVARKWFQDALGFRTAWVWEDSFAAVCDGEVQLYLRRIETPAAGVRCYLHVKDADRSYDRCKRHGAQIVDELESKPWGAREFAVETPGGHIIRVGHGEKRVDEISRFRLGDASSGT
jgi:catechol 2,3-dioxygenase-like lactoylglutathione lyase family enzyme